MPFHKLLSVNCSPILEKYNPSVSSCTLNRLKHLLMCGIVKDMNQKLHLMPSGPSVLARQCFTVADSWRQTWLWVIPRKCLLHSTFSIQVTFFFFKKVCLSDDNIFAGFASWCAPKAEICSYFGFETNHVFWETTRPFLFFFSFLIPIPKRILFLIRSPLFTFNLTHLYKLGQLIS